MLGIAYTVYNPRHSCAHAAILRTAWLSTVWLAGMHFGAVKAPYLETDDR